MTDHPETAYLQRIERATAQCESSRKQWSMLGNVRLVVSVAALVAGWQLLASGNRWWLVGVALGIGTVVALAVRQRDARIARDVASATIDVNRRGLARLRLEWDAVPLPPDAAIDRTHPYAWDLNLVGWGSLAQRIGTPVTNHGWTALYRSLLQDPAVVDVGPRQHAIAQLARQLDVRQRIERVGVANEHLPDPTPLVAWGGDAPWLSHRRWLRLFAWIGPVLVAVAIALTILGVVPWIVVLLPVTLNTLVFLASGGGAQRRVQRIAPLRDMIASYHAIITEIAQAPAAPGMLASLQQHLAGATAALRTLSRAANTTIPPGSMLYFPLQMLTMWDIHLVHRLEQWQQDHGDDLEPWLEAMGEWEALSALSVLAHDHPTWSVPVIDTAATGISAGKLAHPLLAEHLAVANDVDLGPRGALLFVTGSNMSGKSTLLRAIGVNAVLAQAGAPVCAQSLTMPPLRVSSCMRVEDSLAHGVSFFMAELQRLKSVVDRVQASDDRMALYLLDEILQGTNTAERQIASRQVLQQLAAAPAIGAVSSHDLELIAGTPLEQRAIAVHFAEQFTPGGEHAHMTFDYRLRDGVATSSNALRLMELLGFDTQA